MTGKDLEYIRKNILGYSQVGLAKILGLNPSTLCHWESGYRNISHPKMLGLALLQISSEKQSKLQRFLSSREEKLTAEN